MNKKSYFSYFMVSRRTPHRPAFSGATVVGERGQVVIPREARRKLRLQKGSRLLVFCSGNGTLVFAKPEHLAQMTKHLQQRIVALRRMMKKH